MTLEDFMPLPLKGKPSCELVVQSRSLNQQGFEQIEYSGSDGCRYREIVSGKNASAWYGFRRDNSDCLIQQ